MKILVSYPQGVLRKAKRAVEQGIVTDIKLAAAKQNHEVEFVNHALYCNTFYTAYELDRAYRTREPRLKNFYIQVENLLKDFDALLVMDVNVYHPDFLEKLAVYKALYSFDDPDGSFLRTMPYAYAFDHVFTVTPSYNKDISMCDQFRKWGAKNASFVPLGAISSQFSTLDEELIMNRHRSNDIVFVGSSTSPERNDKLFKLKKHFGKRFKLFGQWNWRSNVKNIVRNKNIYWVHPNSDLCSLYLDSKIGVNIHDSDQYGFGNRRNYELPLNGVMLLSDHGNSGLDKIYEVGKEAIAYTTVSEAIDCIEYYLNNEDELYRIALNGFRKAKSKYLFSNIVANVFETMAKEISSGINL